MVTVAIKLKDACLLKEVITNLDSILKRRDITLPTNVYKVKVKVFSVVLYGCESWAIKESWMLKNWRFWTMVSEKTLESPCKEIKPVNPKRYQSWIFSGRTDAEAEAPMLWPPDAKNWLTGKDPDAGKDWSQQEKGTTEDEMVGWYHLLNEHEFEQALGISDRQPGILQSVGSLRVGHSWGLNWTELKLG